MMARAAVAMMLRAAVAVGGLLGLAAVPPPPGASSCTGCHGRVAPILSLHGRDASELIAALDAFRTGERPATLMDRIAKGFSHDESVAIATWLAAQQ